MMLRTNTALAVTAESLLVVLAQETQQFASA